MSIKRNVKRWCSINFQFKRMLMYGYIEHKMS